MTFRRYSKLMSSSVFAVLLVVDGRSRDPVRAGKSGLDDVDPRDVAQYPIIGLRCRSSMATEFCTLRSSSRSVWGIDQSRRDLRGTGNVR